MYLEMIIAKRNDMATEDINKLPEFTNVEQ